MKLTERRVMPFFCDQCGVELSTGHACPECKRILCHTHYFGPWRGPHKRKDGLCAACAAAKKKVNDAEVK